ncbi:sialate O-acetylesterase [Ruficoccus amylovorans]|uniref:Sialate O-acetylesterase n=1 Tax=Ruficoccus amylovorans TaxID=1804625 RepID=A0A842H8E4_9BACT|nr:sialate O-acetylesterase [Ruficoccus amylovorans]MBC2592642.1 sialate O-acetylesterase [Ruficoccus amylovorans]
MLRTSLPLLLRCCLATTILGQLIATAYGVAFAPIFTDHAVLQRDKPISIWGTAKAGEKVRITFGSHTADTVADTDGRWKVELPAMAASSQPQNLAAKGDAASITLTDILVGDVWLASGQSNMGRTVRRIATPAEEVAKADIPLIRHFTVTGAVSDTPTSALGGQWVVCSPRTVGNFTAVGYFFAKDMVEALNVPVGIIHASWGGTRIDTWSSPASIESNPAYRGVTERWKSAAADYPKRKDAYETALKNWEAEAALAKKKGTPFTQRAPRQPEGAPLHFQTPGGLYNGMIHPLIPYGLSGFLWYQGESNALRPDEYAELFPALITDWRKQFQQGNLPFLFVQLASYKGITPSEDWALFREVQSRALSLPATGMAVIIDIGDPEDIHPLNKKDVGKRLALLAKNRIYGQACVDTGPTLQSAVRQGASVRLTFLHADGLHTTNETLREFEVAGKDGVYHAASATQEGDAIIVKSKAVPAPAFVRYAWRNTPVVTLFNAAGLPMVPFRHEVSQ